MAITQKAESLKKKIQIQNMVILALAIVIVVLIVVSSTAAWYIRTKSDSADIILSNPVNIYITEDQKVVQDVLEGYRNRIYPGDRIKLKLGMQLGSEDETSSSAYVRVKLNMAFSKITNDPNQEDIALEELAGQNLIEYEDKPNENNWILIDFNNPDNLTMTDPNYEPDYWYVLRDANSATTARVVQNMEHLEFLDGYIKLSKTEITNQHALHKFHIAYTVEAIQIVNVPDPLAYPGYGPWWNFVKGDLY